MVSEDIACLLPSTRVHIQLDDVDQDVVSPCLFRLLSDCFDSFYSGSDFHEKELKKAQVLLTVAWEKLNTGHWSSVQQSWRCLYSYASLVKALALLERVDPRCPDAVRACDLGLLMGSPVLDNILSKVASVICREYFHTPTELKESNQLTKRFKSWQSPVIRQDSEIPKLVCPSLERFFRELVTPKKPGVVQGAIDYWPAFGLRKWSVGYLSNRIAWRTVPVEIGAKYTDEGWSQQLLTFQEFVQKYITNPEDDGLVGYLAQHQIFQQIPELMDDIEIPSYCYLGSSEEDPDINVWFGPGGTVSPMHYDPKDNLLVQVFGEKYVRLYANEVTPFLYPYEERLLHNTSQVDVECPDDAKFPLFKEASYQECLLRPGEMLYIPAGCWHYVRSLSVSFSISFWWKTDPAYAH